MNCTASRTSDDLTSRKDHPLYPRLLRTRIGTVLQIRARLEDELIRRELAHGPDSEEAELALAALADYEEINAKAIRDAIARQPARRFRKRLSEEDFEV